VAAFLTSAFGQLHANRAFGEQVECGVIRHHKTQLHLAEFSTPTGNHEVKVAWRRPRERLTILASHPAKYAKQLISIDFILILVFPPILFNFIFYFFSFSPR